MSEAAENLAFWQELADLEKEREAAFATRDKDPERWQAAKTAYAQFRSFMRAYRRPADVEVTASAQTAEVAAKATKAGGA